MVKKSALENLPERTGRIRLKRFFNEEKWS